MASVSDVFKQLKQEQQIQTFAEGEETIDSNNYCMLESDTTRKILIPEKYSILGVESDEKVKTVKFAFPRYVDDGRIDLSEYQIRVNYMTANSDTENNIDQIQVQNKHVVGEYVVFEWLLSRRVTQYRGIITFIVCAVTANEDGTITNEWNTTLATAQSLEGLEVELSEEEQERVKDILLEVQFIRDNVSDMNDNVIALEQNCQDYSQKSKSYAVGGTGTREGEDTDNSKYYYEQAKNVSESISGALKPMGTVEFSLLPDISTVSVGDMYNISDMFTTTEIFKGGSGIMCPAGSNIYKTNDNMWDVLAGSLVSGVKGESEETFRTGNVNITKDNMGLGNVPNVATNDQTPTFTTVDEDTALTSGEKLSSILGKLARTVLSVISLKEDVDRLNGKKMDTFFSPEAGIDLYDDGRYMCLSKKENVLNINDTNVANAIGPWCFVISFVYDDTGVQFITSLFSSSAGERTIYKRSKESGNWGKWKAINVTP